MIRNLKTLALAMGAVLLLGGLVASSASATSIWFEGEQGIQTVTFEQEPETWNIFTFTHGSPNSLSVTCTHAHYTNETGTIDTTESEIEVTPTYSGCTGDFQAVIRVNGCDYRFHNPTTNASGQRTANMQITCPAGEEIEIESSIFGTRKCLITVGPQTPSGHAMFTNTGTGSGRGATANITLEGIQYTKHTGTGFAACVSGEGADGTYTGKMKVRGKDHPGNAKGFWIDV